MEDSWLRIPHLLDSSLRTPGFKGSCIGHDTSTIDYTWWSCLNDKLMTRSLYVYSDCGVCAVDQYLYLAYYPQAYSVGMLYVMYGHLVGFMTTQV